MAATIKLQVNLKSTIDTERSDAGRSEETARVKIGDAAHQVGVDAHVLRHWDDLGVVVADRTAGGHRDYTDEHVQRLRILRSCQDIGMSLAEIRLVLHRDRIGRRAALADRLAAIRTQRARLAEAEAFLVHVLQCRHGLVTRCPECSSFAASHPTAVPGRSDR